MKSSLVALVCAGLCVSRTAAQKTATIEAASGGAALCPPCLHDQMLSSLPASIELVIAINSGAKQRSSPAGKALAGFIEGSGKWTETMRAWEVLARTLDWTPERTFDELLGQRISLIARDLGSPEGPDWAVLSAVSGPAELRLRERLRAAPRGAVVGLSVLSIEDGSFQFVVAPCINAAARGQEGSVILLAPRRSEALLDELAPALRGGAAPPAMVGRPCDVVVAYRAAGQAGRTLAITATARSDGWDASIVCAAGYLLENPGAPPRIKPWSDSAFRELEMGSLLAVMSVAIREPLELLPEGIASWKRMLTELGGVPKAGEEALRTAVFVRSAAPTSPVARNPVAVSTIQRVSGDGSAESGPRGRLCVTVAAETRDSRETLVKGDLVMARFARLLMTGEPEAMPGGPQVQFEILDQGPRSLRVGETFAVHPDLEPAVVRGFGESPLLTWSTVNRPGRGGWWVASMSSGEGAGARESRVLIAPEAGMVKARLSMGMIRPAALERWVGAVEPEMLGSMAGAKFVESLRWDSWMRADGRIEAAINIRMEAPAGK